jgi:hypothetical protein
MDNTESGKIAVVNAAAAVHANGAVEQDEDDRVLINGMWMQEHIDTGQGLGKCGRLALVYLQQATYVKAKIKPDPPSYYIERDPSHSR